MLLGYLKDDADKSCYCGHNNDDEDSDYSGADDVNEDNMLVMIMIGHHYDGDDDVFGWSDLNSTEPGHDMFGRLSLTLLARHPFSICIVFCILHFALCTLHFVFFILHFESDSPGKTSWHHLHCI